MFPNFLVLCVIITSTFNEFYHFAGAQVRYGVTYSRLGDNLPLASDAIDLMEESGFQKVRLYSPHKDALEALKGQGLEVILGIDNEDVVKMGYEPNFATQWVKQNVEAYIDLVLIDAIAVGKYLIPDHPLALYVLPAMKNLRGALIKAGLGNIFVTTPFQVSALSISCPPSNAQFDPKYTYIINPIVDFLQKNSSLLLVDIYPHLLYENDPVYMGLPLDYALLNSSKVIIKDGELGYTNMLDGLVDAFYYAMEKIGAQYVRIFVSETGWPVSHESSQIETIKNAETYINNLYKRLNATDGTPKRSWPVEIFVYNLFIQNKAPKDKRHFGLFYPNKKAVINYDII